jgi:type IV pilus assembly protein PilM
VSEILALEVQKTLDFYKTTTRSEDIREIYLSGGACRTQGLQEILQDKFQIPVVFLNPFKRIRASERTFPPAMLETLASDFAVAVGLATRSTGK